MTRRRGHEAVLKALSTALSLPLLSVKLNVVVIKGLNDHEVLDFVELTRDQSISVRFIEFMPFTGSSPLTLILYHSFPLKGTNGTRPKWFPHRISSMSSKPIIPPPQKHQMSSMILRGLGLYQDTRAALDSSQACQTTSAEPVTDCGSRPMDKSRFAYL